MCRNHILLTDFQDRQPKAFIYLTVFQCQSRTALPDKSRGLLRDGRFSVKSRQSAHFGNRHADVDK